jgi:hypothetical protein
MSFIWSDCNFMLMLPTNRASRMSEQKCILSGVQAAFVTRSRNTVLMRPVNKCTVTLLLSTAVPSVFINYLHQFRPHVVWGAVAQISGQLCFYWGFETYLGTSWKGKVAVLWHLMSRLPLRQSVYCLHHKTSWCSRGQFCLQLTNNTQEFIVVFYHLYVIYISSSCSRPVFILSKSITPKNVTF